MHTTRETRFLPGKVELRALAADEQAAGYIGAIEGFVPYESDSRELRDLGGRRFIERLAPGVFARSLENSAHPIFADVGHNDSATFARRGVNLTLTESPAGLAYRALLPDTSTGRDLLVNARLGIIDGTSFEFELRAADPAADPAALGDEWTKREALAVRTIRSAILHRVNPVTEPAYLETTLAARSLAAFAEPSAPLPLQFSEDARETRLRILTK